MKRCSWAEKNELDAIYHDDEWGVPLRDDQKLFEFLILEGAQAGLSWSTILAKRDGYRAAFDDFDAHKIVNYSEQKIAALSNDERIIRNKLKINATVSNAKAYLKIQQREGSFSDYIWGFVNHQPLQNAWQSTADVPTTTKESEVMSQVLKKDGFKFVGPTICYAFMQAVGMVNDHVVDCPCYQKIKALSQ